MQNFTGLFKLRQKIWFPDFGARFKNIGAELSTAETVSKHTCITLITIQLF